MVRLISKSIVILLLCARLPAKESITESPPSLFIDIAPFEEKKAIDFLEIKDVVTLLPDTGEKKDPVQIIESLARQGQEEYMDTFSRSLLNKTSSNP